MRCGWDWEAVVQVAHATGQMPPEFIYHTPYSNRGMEDLLELNEIASATKTEIIPPKSNKTIQAHTPFVLMGTKMNVMAEPLHWTDKALPWGLHVHPSYGTYNCGSQKMTIQLYNTKDHAIIIMKGTAVARMVATNEVPEMVRLEYSKLEDGPGKVVSSSQLRREERSCLKSRSFPVLSPGQKRTRRELSTCWLNTMTSLH